jgi:hypothetical protein
VKTSALFLLLGAVGSAWAGVDVTAIVDESVRNYERDWRAAAKDWTCIQTDVTRSGGKQEVDISEVVPLDGTPYDRLIKKDGQPLPPPVKRKEDRKFERVARERAEESPEEKAARIRKYENERAFVKEIPRAYKFSLEGEESVNGRPAWIVSMTPRPDFAPSMPHANMLSHIEGKLWIDKQDAQWSKAEAYVMDPIGIGWVVARIEKGARFMLEQTRVADGLWMPRRLTVDGTALVLMVHAKGLKEEVTWSDYHRKGSDPIIDSE